MTGDSTDSDRGAKSVHFFPKKYYTTFKLNIPDFLTCRYCQSNITTADLLDHCKFCKYMSRPNLNYKYVCFGCDYHSYMLEYMRRHVRRHTGERPYKCKICNYSSKQPYDLTKHVRIRHNM